MDHHPEVRAAISRGEVVMSYVQEQESRIAGMMLRDAKDRAEDLQVQRDEAIRELGRQVVEIAELKSDVAKLQIQLAAAAWKEGQYGY